jgi:hypothetical protein
MEFCNFKSKIKYCTLLSIVYRPRQSEERARGFVAVDHPHKWMLQETLACPVNLFFSDGSETRGRA